MSEPPRQPADPTDEGGAERLARAARAARELSETVWDCLQEQIAGAEPGSARALAERLAEVSATVALLLEAQALAGERAKREAGGRGPAARSADVERRKPPEPVPAPAGARLVDEQAPTATVTPFAARAQSQSPQTSTAGAETEIEIRDVRREEGASAWITSVGRMLARYGQDRLPFAVLLIEIVDVAHLERSETPHDLHGIVAQVESALGRGMRSTDELSRETLGRYWMLAPETNGTGARMLAERLARLVRGSATHRGAPMEVAIGIAVCPDDGTEAPALAARADLGVYSARATGRSVAHSEPPAAR